MKRLVLCPGCGAVIPGHITETECSRVKKLFPSTLHWNHVGCSDGFTMDADEITILMALSIRQPWAWMIVEGFKKIENRNKLKGFRGPFLVHAPHSFDAAGYDWILRNAVRLGLEDVEIPGPLRYQHGGIVGIGEIVDCVTRSSDPWFSGPNGLVIENAKRIPFIPTPGKLSFFYPKI